MPNYDGTGPLKRGRAIGRGLGPCRQGRDAGTCECGGKTEARKSDPKDTAASCT